MRLVADPAHKFGPLGRIFWCMPRTLTKSIEEYLANNGWSSSAFLVHAKYIFENVRHRNFRLEVGRTVVYVYPVPSAGRRGDRLLLKCYVHYEGRPSTVLSITDDKGKVLADFTPEAKPAEILDYIVSTCWDIENKCGDSSSNER
jgi:hypothetical protein